MWEVSREGGKQIFTVHRVSKSWIEGDGTFGPGTTGATWINTDKSGPTPWSTQGGDFVSQGASSEDLILSMGWKEFEVTEIVTAWITDGQPNYGFLIKLEDEASSKSLTFQSNQVSENRPILQINWVSVPVGGLSMPVNKLVILTPYLALAGLIAAISFVIIKKRK
ncbi:DNRLRE domain-containing protein [Thermoproteota archaeon]